ncbi:PAS domain S-box protein [Nocardioides sp. HDW12B]|uniref:PAS domain S-box protein n=1 Tax=Nocardioides sp. HDW12B TaxID=2714939 RepID=UPI001408944A|nr:PAS domain S-box protein [Nocardioides sp. HDW12B]QIK65175.1 PAS domain S-box protein [Nocardioides sp. HDW12B]
MAAAHEQGIELPAHPSSVSRARQLVRDVVALSASPELSADAELLTSEVVTNALVHAGGPIGLTARHMRDGVRIEVSDGSPHSPIVREYGELAGTGRGLRLLDLLARWGVEESPTGKTVWFELGETRGRGATTVAPDHASAGSDDAPREADPFVDVTLLDVPLLLHAAWQMHAETFLREYLLVRLDQTDDPDDISADGAVIVAHAAASDALALLAEGIPAPDLGDDPATLMDHATGSRVLAPRVTLRVPRESLSNFGLLDEMLDAGLALADEGGFLTPVIQPEMRAMRRWLCASVAEQARGEEPRAWALSSSDLDAPLRAPMAWDEHDLLGTGPATIVADDTNRILAASPGALDLLGYPEGELVGRRLIAIIPERFQQAHLAGFTMHLLSGRRTLLDVPVRVPAVREDGSELLIELTVRRRPSPSGRALFVAELFDAA